MRTYTPAETAELSGFSIDTLRYYEREGILSPVARTAGGRRVYTDDDLGRLGFLRCLRDTGMPIAQLRRYAELSAVDGTLAERIALLEEHDAAVREQLATLKAQQTRLREKLAWYRSELELAAGGRPDDDQNTEYPPSTVSTEPVTNDEASLAR
jgi:DNA-binding transcriptional MerR regulator